jgi:hypothetical protein
LRVEHIDLAVAEVADEDVVAEPAKGEGCPRDAPGRVKESAAGEALQCLVSRLSRARP